MTTTRTRIAALLLAAGVLATACGGDTTAQPEAPIGTADPFPSREADPDDPAEQARQQATAAIEAYNEVENALARDPSSDQAVIATVAAGHGAELLEGTVDRYMEQGVRATGAAVIADMTITNVNVGAETAEVQAEICFDLTDARAVNAAGEDITNPDRPDRVLNTYTITNASWPDPEAWRVSDTEQRNEPCDMV